MRTSRKTARSERTAERKKTGSWLLAAVVIVASVAVAFAPALVAGFTSWDDDINITANPFLHPFNARGLRLIWTKPLQNLYVPLVYTTYGLDQLVGGGRPWAFHLTNVLLHAGSSVLVLAILSGFAQRARNMSAVPLIGALVFALHPLQVEPVVWCTGRKDVMSGFFALASMLFYLNADKST